MRPLSKNKRVVEVDFSHSDRAYKDLKLAELAPMALNIYKLDLSRTQVKDADLAHLAGMKNLSGLIRKAEAMALYLRWSAAEMQSRSAEDAFNTATTAVAAGNGLNLTVSRV